MFIDLPGFFFLVNLRRFNHYVNDFSLLSLYTRLWHSQYENVHAFTSVPNFSEALFIFLNSFSLLFGLIAIFLSLNLLVLLCQFTSNIEPF